MEKVPLVSIGVPVRNGQRYLRAALDSLLTQSFTDFEIIICDNASTDATPRICKEFAARDSRVKYIHIRRNLGPAVNFNHCFDAARGTYFRWHAYDDVVPPNHLAECVAVLQADSDVVLAYPKTVLIDAAGKPLAKLERTFQANSRCASERFAAVTLEAYGTDGRPEIFGLIRASALRETPLIGLHAQAEIVLLARLALAGKLQRTAKTIFFSRRHNEQPLRQPAGTDRLSRLLLTRLLGSGPLPSQQWWQAPPRAGGHFPQWNLIRLYASAIRDARLSVAQRLACAAVLTHWIPCTAMALFRDIAFAAETLSSNFIDRLTASGPEHAIPNHSAWQLDHGRSSAA